MTNKDIKKEWNLSEDLPEIPPPLESLSSPGYRSRNEINEKLDLRLLTKARDTLSTEGLKYFLETWKENREDYEKYKGWIILPKEYRDRLWLYTKEWIGVIFDSYNELPSPNDLFLLYELNWRLEKTLTPLVFNDWIEKITSVVDKFNPYPNLIKLEKSTTSNKENVITPDKTEYQGEKLEWEKITKAWVELAFALLRSARDYHKPDSFNLWKNRLEKIVNQKPQWQSRWFYEQCLFHLSRLENDEVSNLVEKWELTSIPDFWKIRRASILAQLGELKEAQRITERTLKKIRSSIQVYETDYCLLSQEGWAMLLEKEFHIYIQWIKNPWENEEIFNLAESRLKRIKGRWRQLDKYDCNPNTEIETLKRIIDKSLPQLPSQQEVKRDFLPEFQTTTRHFGTRDLLSDIRPAFESLRIFEESGILLRINNVAYYTKDVENATKWTIPFFPTWSFLTLIQVSKDKSVKDWLSFVDIAILPQEQIDYLYKIIDSFFLKVVEQLSNLKINAIFSNEYLDLKLPVFTETLSYLCLRLKNTQLEQVFDLAVTMYKIEAFRKSYCLYNLQCKLFEKLFYVLPQSEIIEKLDILLSLPIVGEKGFVASRSDKFLEPFYYINFSEDFKIDDDFDRTQWSESIARLTNIVQNDTSEARKRAIFRLGELSIIGGLTSEQENLFAQALYSQKGNNIPKHINVYSSLKYLLFLPEENPGQAREIISQYLIDELENINNLRNNYKLNKEQQNQIKSLVDKNIKTVNGVSSNGIDRINRHLQDIYSVSCPLYKNNKSYDKYIDWSRENAEYFLSKINELWQNNKEYLIECFSNKNHHFYQRIVKIIKVIDDCLYKVILPRLKDSEYKFKQLAKKLISDLENNKIPILSTLPMMLFIDKDCDVNNIAKKLIFGLSSLNQSEINSATMGIKNWLICSQQKQIPQAPPNLLNELISKVIYYRQPRFNFAVYILGELISIFPDILIQEQIESLLLGLEYLLQETKLPDNWLDWKLFNHDINTMITIEDRPKYMEYCAYLAYQIYQLYESKEQPIPDILTKWKESSLKSVFPRVRKVWQE